MAILEVNEMLANTYEPKRKYRWIVSIDGIDSFVAKTASRPEQVFDEIAIDYINSKRFLAGKMTPSELNLVLFDPITPSASQKVMEWSRLCYEAVTGRAGYAVGYKKTIYLKLLDPVGAIVEEWELQGTWIKTSNFGELDYASSDPVEIALTLRFDTAILNY